MFLATAWNWLPLIASLDVLLTSPSFTFVIFTGFVPSLSETLILPPVVAENLGPVLPPTCTVVKEGVSIVANVILPLVSCFTSKFLPAIISTVLPALMDSPVAATVLPAFLVPSVVALAFNVKAALLIALTTLATVATLLSSPVFDVTVPVVFVLIVPVLTCKPLFPVVIVVPSVFTLRPSFVTSKDVSAGLTFTPSLPTVKDVSAAFTETVFPVASFCKPLPRFTLYFTVEVLPSVLSTVAVVPSPLMKFTVSYGFTKSTAVPLPCKFQPAFNTSDTVAPLFGFT